MCEIVDHEKECPERTVKCTIPRCSQVVQLKMFPQHAKDCFGVNIEGNRIVNDFRHSVSTNYLVWDGKSKVPRQEFDLQRIMATLGWSFMQLNKKFYAYTKYTSVDKFFLFFVLIGEGKTSADKYRATIEVFNKDKEISTSITCPVLPLEEFPESNLDRVESPLVWKIPYEMMRNMFTIQEIKNDNGRSDEPKNWRVYYEWRVTMKEK